MFLMQKQKVVVIPLLLSKNFYNPKFGVLRMFQDNAKRRVLPVVFVLVEQINI